MDFELPEEYKELQLSLKKLVKEKILPQIFDYEQKSLLPRKIFSELGTAGFLKVHVPQEYGGTGLGTIAYCLVAEELSKAGAGLTHNGHFQTVKMLCEYGTPKQQEKYLPKLLNGEYLAATAITEPEVGSSFASMKTRLSKHNNHFILDGIKTLINDASEADIISILAKSDKGISILLLEKDTPGFQITKKMDPMGLRSSPVYEFVLKGCKVESEQLIGKLDEGLQTFFSAFNFSRLGNASAALGISYAALEKAINYIKTREVGKYKVADFQGIRWILAQRSAQLEAARLLRDKAAIMEDMKQDVSLISSQAKLLSVDVANCITGDCIQTTGRYGCLRDNLLEMYFRDAKTLGTAGGSLEVMKNNIARRLIDQ